MGGDWAWRDTPDSALRLHQEYGARPMAPPAQDQGGGGGTEGDYYNNNSKPTHTQARGTQPPTPPTKRKSGATSGTSTCTSVLLVPSIQSRHTTKAVKTHYRQTEQSTEPVWSLTSQMLEPSDGEVFKSMIRMLKALMENGDDVRCAWRDGELQQRRKPWKKIKCKHEKIKTW